MLWGPPITSMISHEHKPFPLPPPQEDTNYWTKKWCYHGRQAGRQALILYAEGVRLTRLPPSLPSPCTLFVLLITWGEWWLALVLQTSLPHGLTVSLLLSGACQIPLSFLLWNVLVCSGEIRVLCDPALPPQQRVPERINVNWWVNPLTVCSNRC